MMIVDLAQLEGSHSGFEFTIAAGDLDLVADNVRFMSDTAVSGEISKNIAKTDVTGTINFAAEIDCTRCLAPIEKELSLDFEVSYIASDDFLEDGDAELEAADLDVDMLEGDELDLREVVREQILLNLPNQIFCKDDCKGLCQKCGANLNLIDCSCEETEIDPRWAALKNLK